MDRTARAAVVSVLLLAATGGAAGAGPLPATWSYWNPGSQFAVPDGATGGLSFPNTVPQTRSGDGEIVAAVVASYSVAPADAPDRAAGLPYTFTLDLRDDRSGEVAALSFTGSLSGDLWRTGTALRNQFTGDVSRSATLGGTVYTVTLNEFDAPASYGDGAAGEITALVTVGRPPAPVATPEPASVALGLAGIVATGLCGRPGGTRTRGLRPGPTKVCG